MPNYPANEGYMWAGYAVTFVIVVAYAALLWRRAGRAGRG